MTKAMTPQKRDAGLTQAARLCLRANLCAPPESAASPRCANCANFTLGASRCLYCGAMLGALDADGFVAAAGGRDDVVHHAGPSLLEQRAAITHPEPARAVPGEPDLAPDGPSQASDDSLPAATAGHCAVRYRSDRRRGPLTHPPRDP